MSPGHHKIVKLAQGKTQLNTFKDDLVGGITGAYPILGRTTPYHHVRVTLVHWDVDTNAEKSAMEMGHVFQVYYGFECKTWVINARSATITPEQSFQRICIKTGYAGRKGDLTIFYYAGHSIWDPRHRVLRFQSGSYSVIENNSSIPQMARASVDFTTQSRANLDMISDSALLYLLDTGVHASGSPITTNAERELLAAIKIDPMMIATTDTDSNSDDDDHYGNGNWTKQLCQYLRIASRTNEPLTVAQLFGKMIQSLLEADAHADGGKLDDYPVHSRLMPSMGGRSIILAPESARTWTGFGEIAKPLSISDSGKDQASPEVLTDNNDASLKVKQQDHENKHELIHPQARSRPMAFIYVQLDFQLPKIAGEKPPPPLSAPAIVSMIDNFKIGLFEFIKTTYSKTSADLPSLTPMSLAKIWLSPHYLTVFASGHAQCLSCAKSGPTAGSRKKPESGVVLSILLPVEVWVCMRPDLAYAIVEYVMSTS